MWHIERGHLTETRKNEVLVISLLRVRIILIVGSTGREHHFGIGIILGTSPRSFAFFRVIVPVCCRNGSEERPYLWVQEKFI